MSVHKALRALAVIAAALFAFDAGAQAQGTWTLKANSLNKNRAEAVAELGGKLYAVGGAVPCSSASASLVESYDPALDLWTQRASLPVASQQSAAAAINGILYAVGGGSAYAAHGDLQAYDPSTNVWVPKPSMPTPRYAPIAGAVNGKLYVMGGGSGYGTAYTNIEEYDPASNSWAPKGHMPVWRYLPGVAVSGGVMYLFGGQDLSGNLLAPTEAYDPATGVWIQKAPIPTLRILPAACVLGGLIWVVGGHDATGAALKTVEVYDPATNTWTVKAPTPVALEAPKGAAAVNGVIYVVGNEPGQNSYCPGSFLTVLASTPSSPTVYCTAKTNSLGCIPSVSSSGVPSATAGSGFTVNCTNVRNQKPGLLFYSNQGQNAAPFQGGTLCIKAPIRRTPAQSSGGTPLPTNDCTGLYAFDMNCFAVGSCGGSPDPFLTSVGIQVNCQWWGRDPGFPAPNNTTLSNGLEYVVGP